MFKRHGRCIVLCLCFFLIGILMGGCIIVLRPHNNHIYLTVLPNHKINVSPQVGDVIEWSGYHKDTPPIITFSPGIGIPCAGGKANPCRFNDTHMGIFPYGCSGSANCDPGIGPKSGTGIFDEGTAAGILTRLARILETLVLGIDQTFGLVPTPTRTNGSEGTPAPSVEPALRMVDDHDGEITCDNNHATTVTPANIMKKIGDTIVWLGRDDFTISIHPLECQGDTSIAGPYQECKLVGGTVGVAFDYTVTDKTCTTQPTVTAHITPQ